jgi:hypothetical protein
MSTAPCSFWLDLNFSPRATEFFFKYDFIKIMAQVCVTTVHIGLYLLINMLNHDEPLLCVQFIVKKKGLLTLRVKYEDTKVGHFSTH